MLRDDIRELNGRTIWIRTGCGKLYITLNSYEDKIVEIFLNLGKSGGCASGFLEAIGRLISVGLQDGLSLDVLIKQLVGIKCSMGCYDNEYHRVDSCLDAVSKVLSVFSENGIKNKATGEELNFRCPECSSNDIEWQGRCFVCLNCGFSKC